MSYLKRHLSIGLIPLMMPAFCDKVAYAFRMLVFLPFEMMKLIQQFGVLMALSFSWQVSLTGQPAGELPAITPSSIKLFDGKDYKEDYCTEYAVKDADGRLWLRTCDVMERPYLIQLLQYDGYRITPVELANPKLTSGANVELSGYDNRIGLYGCINGFTGEAYLFGYQAKLDSTLLTPLGKGTVTGIAPRKSGGYWVAAKKPDHIVFYTWDGTHLEEAAVLPYTGELKPLEKQASNISSGGSFFQEGDFLYYFDGPFPVIKYDLNKSAAQFISGGGATDANAETWVNPPGKYHLESGRGRIYYLEFGESPDFYLLDDQAGQFNSLNIVPEGGTGKAIFKDSQGNLLFAYLDNKAQQRAILLDTDGRYWEYSAMIRGLPRINSIASEDFKREAFVTTATGAYLSVAGLNSAIKTYLPGLSIREIGETGPGNYLIKIDRFRWFALNESEGKTSPFGGGGPCLSLISKEAKTGYITLVTDPERRLWLGSENELTRYPLNNRDTCISYSLNGIASKFPVFLKNGSLAAIDMNRLGNRQLFYFDPRKNESTPALSGGQPVKFNSPVTCLLEGGDSSLWIATINGLYRIRPDGDKVEHLGFTPDFEDFRSVVLHEDRQGRIWIGTVKGGLQILDPRLNKVVKSVTIKKGLANNTVVNILEDDDGDFWVGTYNGISILNANGDVINNLNEEDGLCFHEFNRYAHFRASNGKLLMGTLNGLNLIDPRKVKEELNNRDTTQIYLTEISYFDGRTQREVSLRNPDLAGRRIVLEADRRYLRITAGMSNYGFSQKNNFAYKLEGVNSDWNYLGGQHTINLSNLPAGKYRLLITGIDERGKWAARPIELKIFAREFFYKQHWFYAALLAALFVLAFLWIRYLRSEKMRLESEVRRRTRRIESDKELILQQAHELRKLDELKSRFFTNISHELRTPVALITTPIEQLIKSKNGELGERAQKSLRMALNNGRNLLRLVEELLDLSKLDAGKLTLQETPTPLVDFCRGLFSAFESRANIRNIRYQYHSGLPPGNVYLVDRKCLEKIVNNLLSNALKFTHEGGCVELAVGAVAAPGDRDNGPASGSPEGPPDFTLTIAVKDDGRGIPPEDLPHVFDRYFQTNREGLSIEGGTGVGLALSRELARLMGGSLGVQSAWGSGSTFTLAFPARLVEVKETDEASFRIVQPESKPDQENPLPGEKTRPETGKRANILIVEDNPDMQQLIFGLLSESYNCYLAADGAEAWSGMTGGRLGRLEIDLILSDIMMPEMDGYELLGLVKEHPQWKDCPIVMITARADERDKLKALRMGVDDYLLKPFSPDELAVRVANLIANDRRRKAFLEDNSSGVDITFEATQPADEHWLQELETVAKAALNQRIDFTATYLAEKMSLSERQLLRRITTLTGLSSKQYILEIKLQKARHLLEHRTFRTISEVAYASGFNTPGYFTKVYEKHFGKRPAEYLESFSKSRT